MGFPTWTLLGMGIMGAGALITTLLTYIALSPQLQGRLGLGGTRIGARVREFVGYTLACLLLMIGFFLAGVPLGEPGEDTAVALVVTATFTPTSIADVTEEVSLDSEATPTISINLEDSGSFGQLPNVTEEISPTATLALETVLPEEGELAEGGITEVSTEEVETPEVGETAVSPPDSVSETSTPTPTLTPSSTPTPTPTATPTPVPTATAVPPIGETATIQTGGNTLWVRRTPGGQTLTLLNDGESVVLESRYANWQGIVWREVRTLDGTLGWVQFEFLEIE